MLNLFVCRQSRNNRRCFTLTRELIIGSVQLPGVRQALVAVFRLHFPRVRRNVELWETADMLAILFQKIKQILLLAFTEDGYKYTNANKS